MADVLCTVKLRVSVPAQALRLTVGQEVYAFDGTDTDRYLNVHVFNTVSLKWTRVFPRDDTCYKDNREVPCMRSGFTSVLIDNGVYIWGGMKSLGTRSNVLYAFDVDTHTWLSTEVSGTVPEARCAHSACVSGKVMYIHGGLTQTGLTNDVYRLDTSTMVWSSIEAGGTPPPASYGHSATSIGTQMFVFGGYGDEYYNTIRVFDTESHHWLTTGSAQPLPVGRWGNTAFAYNGELHIIGTTDTFECNLWKYSPEAISRKTFKPKGNGPLWTYVDSCCVVGDCVFVIGDNSVADGVFVYILDFSPSLETLCKLSVLEYGLDQSELPYQIREELAAMTRTE